MILTGDYGEAGAIDRYGPALGLPQAYSGHNAFWDWGPPPDYAAPVIAIGLPVPGRVAELRGCTIRGRIDNGAGIDNEEDGTPVYVCARPTRPWAQEWPAFKNLG